MAAAAGGNKVRLKSSDGVVFEVEEAVAMESQTIKHMIEVDCAGGDIPLSNVTGKILAKVIEYCEKHVDMQKQVEDSQSADEELEAWDAKFVKVDGATLFDLMLAANYLSIKSLLDLTFQTAADMIKDMTTGMTPEEIRQFLNITPEEEEEVRRLKENQ